MFTNTKQKMEVKTLLELGTKIKTLRIKNNLTLEELASRCELTKGFLSQLERDLTSPSISTLHDILEALGTTLAEFFQGKKEEQIVFTNDDYFIDERDGYKISWIVPNAQKNEMEPILIEIEPKSRSQLIVPHEGEEFGLVLEGRITLVYGDHETVVRKGQNFYIKGENEHYLRNDGSYNAKLLWICTPPIF